METTGPEQYHPKSYFANLTFSILFTQRYICKFPNKITEFHYFHDIFQLTETPYLQLILLRSTSRVSQRLFPLETVTQGPLVPEFPYLMPVVYVRNTSEHRLLRVRTSLTHLHVSSRRWCT